MNVLVLSAESLGVLTKNEQYHRIHSTLLKAGMKLFAHFSLCAKYVLVMSANRLNWLEGGII